MLRPRPQKLLIIDEMNYTRLILSQALTNNGYKVATALNSGEAMQQIAAELPDVILFSLPSTSSGVSALRKLKDYFRLRLDLAQGAEPAIIMLSDFRDTGQIREIQTLGISHTFPKPVNIQELLELVNSVISSSRNTIPEQRMMTMILDVEVRSQQFLESVLAHEMYDFEFADSEAEFLARIKNGGYDLSIIDLVSLESEMPAALKSIVETAEGMPIMTIATSADQISEDELKQFGIYVHFIKPIQVDIFRTEVDALLQEQAGSQEKQMAAQEETAEETDQESDDQAEEA